MKDFRLGVLDENGELKVVSPEFFKPTEVDFDMSDIESHHPYSYTDLSAGLTVELAEGDIQGLCKALDESKVSRKHSITVYKDYIYARVYINRGFLTNRRICEEEVKSFITTLRVATRGAYLEAANMPEIRITPVHKRFGRKKKKRIKKQFGGLPLQTIIEKLFMEQLKRRMLN